MSAVAAVLAANNAAAAAAGGGGGCVPPHIDGVPLVLQAVHAVAWLTHQGFTGSVHYRHRHDGR